MNANERKLPRIKKCSPLSKRGAGGDFLRTLKPPLLHNLFLQYFECDITLYVSKFSNGEGLGFLCFMEADKKTFRSVTMPQLRIKTLAVIRVYLRSFAFSFSCDFSFYFSFKFHSNA